MVADGVEDAMSPDGRHQLFHKKSQEDRADSGEVEVVDHEQSVQLDGLEPLHDLAAAEDEGIVGDEQRGGLVESGQGGDAFDELEVAGGVSDDVLKGLVEDGPQMNAKGTIYSRGGDVLEEVGHCGREAGRWEEEREERND